jgi:TolA-binding protein
MARPSDREYKLQHQIRELREQVEKLEVENARLKKQIEKTQAKEEPKAKKVKHAGGCPVCEAPIKVTDLPFGKLRLCSAQCGWRKVDGNN